MHTSLRYPRPTLTIMSLSLSRSHSHSPAMVTTTTSPLLHLAPCLPSPLHPTPGATITRAKGWSESEGQEEGEQERTKGG